MRAIPEYIHGDPKAYPFLLDKDKRVVAELPSPYSAMGYEHYFSDERQKFSDEVRTTFASKYAGSYWELHKNKVLEDTEYIIENMQLKYSYFIYTALFDVPCSFSKKKPKTKLGIIVMATYSSNNYMELVYPAFYGPIIEPVNISLDAKLYIRMGNSSVDFNLKTKEQSLVNLIKDINDRFNDKQYKEFSAQFDLFSGIMLMKKANEIHSLFSKKAIFYLHNYDNWNLILKEADELITRGNELGEFIMLLKQISILKGRLEEMVKTE